MTGNESGLAAYFPLNDGSGTTAADLANVEGGLTLLGDPGWTANSGDNWLASGVTINEDTPLRLTSLSVSDADAASAPISVTLSVQHGTLAFDNADIPGLDGDLDGSDGTLSLTGSQSAINAALANGVVYTPDADYSGPSQLTVTVNDQGHNGPGGALTATQQFDINVASVNDAPEFAGHGAAAYVPGGPAVSIASDVAASDVDSDRYGDGSFTATVTAGGNQGDILSIVDNAFISVASIASGHVVMFDSDGDGDTSNAIAIGDLADNDGNVNSVTVGLNDNATDAAVEALAQAIQFENGKENAAAGLRTVTFKLHDGGGTAHGGHDSDFFEATVNVTNQAAATTLTFDDLPAIGNDSPVPNGYGGFTWSNFYYLNASNYTPVSGYNHGMVSASNVAYNGYGMTAAVSGATFNFIGAYLTGAWHDDLSVTVVAYDHNLLVDQQTVVVDTDAPTWFEFDFMGITDLVFSSSGGADAGYGYSASHFVLDDFTFSMSANQAPVISTDNLQLSESNGMTTVFGLSVSDPDATSNESFTVTAVTEAEGSSVTIPSSSGTLSDINVALDTGVTYHPGSPEPETDMVTFSVADGHGGRDTVNFIFNQSGEGPLIALQGTVLKDVILATGYSDTLTGGASADQFVFAANSGHDTITDFTPGQDRIDLHDYLPFGPGSGTTFGEWIADNESVEQVASGTLIHLDPGDSILLSNVSKASLQMNDFILHPGGGNVL